MEGNKQLYMVGSVIPVRTLKDSDGRSVNILSRNIPDTCVGAILVFASEDEAKKIAEQFKSDVVELERSP